MHAFFASLRRVAAFALCAVAPLAPAAPGSAAPIRIALIEGVSGPFANAGAAVVRNLSWAVERINARGGVQ
ncbi:MAG: branched-chain amino acid ABC transporter substrate-binding protein, partial [Betaproteobacteria bacterium]|nr:branched-chain amino acid ABC transporter substrate-binding protein [Betaproteobacteria bacterium]